MCTAGHPSPTTAGRGRGDADAAGVGGPTGRVTGVVGTVSFREFRPGSGPAVALIELATSNSMFEQFGIMTRMCADRTKSKIGRLALARTARSV